MDPWFIATEKFGPESGERWESFIQWAKLRQLEEVVSLDQMLCPTVLPEIKAHYWPHIVNQDFMLHFFTDLDFLMQEVSHVRDKNLLCVFRNPDAPVPAASAPKSFEFLGYDLVDVHGDVSALTNCGGFPEAFSNDELSVKGLLTSHSRALEVQRTLQQAYPKESHANCHVWAIFRATEL